MTDVSKVTKDFVQQSIQKGQREDGRGLLELRQLQIIFNFEEDGVEVCLGETRVWAKIKSEIVEPKPERPHEGFLTFKTNLHVLSEPTQDFKNKGQKSTQLSTEISKILERAIKGSKAFDCDSLCILAGKFVWDIVVELTQMNNDGNLIDTLNYATIIALSRYRKPFVGIEGGLVRIFPASEKQPQFLVIYFSKILESSFPTNHDDFWYIQWRKS